MSEDISYARYYRPSSLDDYIGNTKIKETVRRALQKGKKRPQSILLTGNTGCGKTTLARIIMSWYMCEDPNEDGSPCGVCQTCQAMKEYIRTGNSEMLPDIKEIDSGEKSGKSDMASILEEMEYPAYGGGWKVYYFDESHLLSQGSSGALLKPLEEPPEKVLIIFATTDPQRMIETVKNRAQLKLKVTKPTTVELSGLLKRVCLDRGKDYDMQGLRMICSRADYVIRNSLNYLEQVLENRGGATGELVAEEFQEVSDQLIFDFYDTYIRKDYLGYINVLYKIKVNYDFGIFLTSLTNFTVRGIYILNNITVEGMTELEMKSYYNVFSQFSIEEISSILERLKKMSYGDVEANLMSFIYNESSRSTESTVKEIKMPEVGVSEEKHFRNDNLKALEMSKVREGQASLQNSMEEVSFEDAMPLFNLEKVKEE